MKFSRGARIITLLFIDVVFFFVELIVGYAIGSLALVADSFHMLNDIISLIVALYAIKLLENKKNEKSPQLSYGWHRAEVLAALVNGVFLLALCFSIFLEAIERFFNQPEISNPKLIVIVGSLGLISNFAGLALFNEHGHDHEHEHEHDEESGDHAAEGAQPDSLTYGSEEPSSVYVHPIVARQAIVEEAEEIARAVSPERGRRSSMGVGSPGSGKPRRYSTMPVLEAHDHDHAHGEGEDDSDHDHTHAHEHPRGRAVHSHATERQPLLGEHASAKPQSKSVRRFLHTHGDGTTHDLVHDHDNIAPNDGRKGHDHDALAPKRNGSGGHGHSHGNMNMRALVLHVIGDALGNIGVIITGLIIWFATFPGKYYADPIISLVITVIIFSSAMPLVRSASFILLQAVPNDISLIDVRDAVQNVPGVQGIHELHVWQLSETKVVASVHVWVTKSKPLMDVAKAISKTFHDHGIHSCTIQPEYHPEMEQDDHLLTTEDTNCLLSCGESGCQDSACCPPVDPFVEVTAEPTAQPPEVHHHH